jgi:hypothetical protein
MLTQDTLKELFHYDPEEGIFTRKLSTSSNARVGDIAGSKNSDGYIQIMINKNLYYAHRLAWLYFYGKLPIYIMDHINGIKDDNRIVNLREVTRQDNNQNKKKQVRQDPSIPTGVKFARNRK